jgi:hypothetical protein
MLVCQLFSAMMCLGNSTYQNLEPESITSRFRLPENRYIFHFLPEIERFSPPPYFRHRVPSKVWSPIMRAWILLGTNCAFGGHEVATLTIEEIDFENGRIRRFREKTKIYAEWKLWDVTLKYLRTCLDLNKKPLLYADHFTNIPEKHNHRLLFKTQQNQPLIHTDFSPDGMRCIDSIN